MNYFQNINLLVRGREENILDVTYKLEEFQQNNTMERQNPRQLFGKARGIFERLKYCR